MSRFFTHFKINVFFVLLSYSVLCARQIDTFYGPIEVNEPVLLELIDHPVFQRLKNIHQYGVAYYTTHTEEYNRYDHSLGVFALLREHNASLEEQIAGLLHDVSHTAFSHVGDWVFGKENQDKDYQNDIHIVFLKESGLADVLEKFNFSAERMLPTEESFPALENSLPNLCADRIDYNIQGAYYQGFITHQEAVEIFNDLSFVNNKWVSEKTELMKKLTEFSLVMTKSCWGGSVNYVTSRWLADAILRAIEVGSLSSKDFHYGTDQDIWDKLIVNQDSIIKKKMEMLLNFQDYFFEVEVDSQADYIVKSKFRGINPWIFSGSECIRLIDLDDNLAQEYQRTKELMSKGWFIKILSD